MIQCERETYADDFQPPPAPSLPPIGLPPTTTTAVSQLPHLDDANGPTYYDDTDNELTLEYPDE